MVKDRIGEPLLQTIVQRLLVAGSPQKIILFGSQARGQADRESDYDLLIIEKTSQSRFRRAVSSCPKRPWNLQRYCCMDAK